jgi:hypothetical protein
MDLNVIFFLIGARVDFIIWCLVWEKISLQVSMCLTAFIFSFWFICLYKYICAVQPNVFCAVLIWWDSPFKRKLLSKDAVYCTRDYLCHIFLELHFLLHIWYNACTKFQLLLSKSTLMIVKLFKWLIFIYL